MASVAQAPRAGRRRRLVSANTAAGLRHLGLRGAAILYLGAFIIIPVSALIAKGFGDGLTSLRSALAVPGAWGALRLTLVTSALTALINAVMGTLIAYVLVRTEFPGKRFLSTLVDLPIALPTLVTGLMLVAFYGPNSPVGGALPFQVIFTPIGIQIALLVITMPFVIRTVQPVLLELDPAEEEAATTLGANGWTTFRKVVLPAIRPAIAAGALLSFARSLGEFGSIIFVAGNITNKTLTAPVFIFQLSQQEISSGAGPAKAAAISTLLVGLAFIVVLSTARLLNREGKV